MTLAAANGDVLALYNIGIILQREAAKGASGKSAYEPATMAAVRACFAAAAQRGMGAAMLAMVETYEAEDAREQYTRQEREELMHYWFVRRTRRECWTANGSVRCGRAGITRIPGGR